MEAECKSNDAGNLDVPKISHKVFLLSEELGVLGKGRQNIYIYIYVEIAEI